MLGGSAEHRGVQLAWLPPEPPRKRPSNREPGIRGGYLSQDRLLPTHKRVSATKWRICCGLQGSRFACTAAPKATLFTTLSLKAPSVPKKDTLWGSINCVFSCG